MPTYQYACTECKHRFEAVQAFTDAALSECPECAGRLRKLYGSIGVVFKGSGFYRTDSRSSAKSDSGDSPAATSTTPKSTSSSDSSTSTPAAPAKSESSSTTTSTSTSSTAKAS
ncbi:MAG: FmdB family transcriptional regulator [Actinomycetota bacterium]|nr:FmdB family transcriptional regulator [Actinomycetota bacterium]